MKKFALTALIVAGCAGAPTLSTVLRQVESARHKLAAVHGLVCGPELVRPEIVDECADVAQVLAGLDADAGAPDVR